jgi:alpha-L-arabinofuranosidase
VAKVKIVVDRHFEISEIDKRIYGSFTEHMGRCVYGGIYEPGSPFADENGFRTDVIELVRELGVSIVRYPGGNFLSGYDWKDGVGPKEDRPQRLDLAWHSLETNQFGLDEFMDWSEKTGVEPMMAVNLGSAGLKDALELLEYTNVDAESKWAQYRVKNGNKKPYDIKVWCLGNEMDGPWQLGHKNAKEYAKVAGDVARGMRQMGEDLELVICGSSNRAMPTFGQWEETVLEDAYDLVDHISLHTYYEGHGDIQSFLACSVDLDYFINEVCEIADAVKAKLRSKKTITLSLDEWNVWRLSEYMGMERPKTWEIAPKVIEDEYNVADALVVGNLLISILRRSDRVKMACLAQLVNVIAPIRTEPDKAAWRQTTFYPFAYTAKYGKGKTLTTRIEAGKIETNKFGSVDGVDAITTYDASTGELAIFLINRSLTDAQETSINLAGFKVKEVLDQVTLDEKDLTKTNNYQNSEAVAPRKDKTAKIVTSGVEVSLPPASWQVINLLVEEA